MANLEVWQLITDALLVLSLFYLCARSAKVSPLIQSSNLESNLRRMVQEADLVTRALQEKLVQRQTRLEELLMDLESAENRLNRGKQDIEETRADLESRFIKAQRALQALQIQIDTVSNTKPARPQENEVVTVKEEKIEAPIVNTKTIEATPQYESTTYGRNKAVSKAYGNVKNNTVKKNIYGEIIDDTKLDKVEVKSAPVAKKGLAGRVEKEVIPQTPKSIGYSQDNDIQSVYDKAEELLSAGQELESVARLTSLPVEEVKMLAQMLDRVPQTTRNDDVDLTENALISDQRLGALSPIRRQIQTV